jgi:hypothetical protein
MHEYKIKVNVREIICNGVVRIEMVQNTDQWQMLSSSMNIQLP